MVVDDRSAGSILLPNKEHWSGNQTIRVSGFSPTSIEHFIEDFLALGTFFLVHVVWLTWLWQQFQRVKVNCEIRIWSEIGKSSGGLFSIEPVQVVMIVLGDICCQCLEAFQNINHIELDFLGGEQI